jgi:RNA polymerase sigma-70 factor (ECF subfamily)
VDDERRLLRLCQQGDEAALAELIRRYQERVYRLAWRVLGDATLAEEAAAATFVKVWAKCGSWRDEAAVGTWVYRLAIRTALDVRRAQHRWWRRFTGFPAAALADPREDAAQSAAEHDERQALARRLERALVELSHQDRALVHLYYFEQRSLAELEVILGVARATLKTRLARARQRLRTLLEGYDVFS